jgi:tryptophanase
VTATFHGLKAYSEQRGICGLIKAVRSCFGKEYSIEEIEGVGVTCLLLSQEE